MHRLPPEADQRLVRALNQAVKSTIVDYGYFALAMQGKKRQDTGNWS
jgi:hypothetical protein